MAGHDYTDSEPEIDPDDLVQDHDHDQDQDNDNDQDHDNDLGHYNDHDHDGDLASPTTASNASPTKEPPRSKDSGQSLKITLRPNLASSSSHSHSHTHVDDETPPPPHSIKLKLGMKHAIASYSSSEDEGEGRGDKERSPPAKKQRTGKKARASPSKDARGGGEGAPAMPAPHRKAYDWLPSSAAGASHHGPPDRHQQHEEGSDAGTEPGAAEKEAKPRKGGGRKRAPDAPPGPGKNWRKGMRKGDPIPWKDGATFLGGEGKPRSSPLSTPARASASRDVSPESIDDSILAAVATVSHKKKVPVDDRARSPSPPFVLADAGKLGFPVFANPIVAPKIALSSFPKVTSSFAPFDNKPFRKEKVREWTSAEQTLVGIGGGRLRFKTWARGPPSEFGVIAAQMKEAELLAKQRKKEAKEIAEREGSSAAEGARPLFGHSQSSESVPLVGDESELASEAGDGDDSLASIASASSTPAPTPRGRGKKAKPRKSKLAQEIVPDDIE